MSNLLLPPPDTCHPEWCDPEYCELLQPQRLSEHRSRPIVIERVEMFIEKMTVWLAQFAFEPPETAPIYVNVRFERVDPNGEVDQVSTHAVRLDQAAQLGAALAGLAKRGEEAQRRCATAERCAAAHREDPSRCEGPADAVRIVDQAGTEVTGCVRHGAVLLASLERGRVYPGSVEGAAIEVFQTAQHLPPFAFERAVDRGESGTLPPEAVPAVNTAAEWTGRQP